MGQIPVLPGNEILGNITLAQQETEARGSWPGRGGAKAKTFLLFVEITQKTCREFTKVSGRLEEEGNWPSKRPINLKGVDPGIAKLWVPFLFDMHLSVKAALSRRRRHARDHAGRAFPDTPSPLRKTPAAPQMSGGPVFRSGRSA